MKIPTLSSITKSVKKGVIATLFAAPGAGTMQSCRSVDMVVRHDVPVHVYHLPPFTPPIAPPYRVYNFYRPPVHTPPPPVLHPPVVARPPLVKPPLNHHPGGQPGRPPVDYRPSTKPDLNHRPNVTNPRQPNNQTPPPRTNNNQTSRSGRGSR